MSIDKVYQSILYLPDQIRQVIHDVGALKIPDSYLKISNIVISGMGGSLYNYHVINSLFKRKLVVPIYMTNNYDIPLFINDDTLFIGSSYSGSTEEVISATSAASIKNAKIITISSGGDLAQLGQAKKAFVYRFSTEFNPSGQPRLGLGYMIFSTISILIKLSLIKTDLSQLESHLTMLGNQNKDIESAAQDIVDKIKDKMVVFIAEDHLSGNVHIFRNQLNETAKTFSEYHLVPELNHHLIEGLKFPQNKKLIFLIFESDKYLEKNQKRITITKKLLEMQSIPFLCIKAPSGVDEMGQFLYLLQLNSFISYYLSKYYQVDPIAIPWVNYFKKELQSS